MIEYDKLREVVARAICSSVGRDPNARFVDRYGKTTDFPEWERWGGEAGAAINAMHAYLSAADVYWNDCQECGVGHSLDKLLPKP